MESTERGMCEGEACVGTIIGVLRWSFPALMQPMHSLSVFALLRSFLPVTTALSFFSIDLSLTLSLSYPLALSYSPASPLPAPAPSTSPRAHQPYPKRFEHAERTLFLSLFLYFAASDGLTAALASHSAELPLDRPWVANEGKR
eukprot:Sspe_Gene.15525::Locus_5405_Transcript_1_1_Confidence_1.000_Length_795::g.15525::m.15525